MEQKFVLKIFKSFFSPAVFLMHFSYALFWPLKYTLKLVLTSGKQNHSTIFQFFVSVFVSIVSNKYNAVIKMFCQAILLGLCC